MMPSTCRGAIFQTEFATEDISPPGKTGTACRLPAGGCLHAVRLYFRHQLRSKCAECDAPILR